MKNNNQIIASTISSLNKINHPDSYRIAKEICEFANYNIRKISNILEKLKNDKPWEYIRGWAEFNNLRLIVNKHTLIPRLETLQILDIVSHSKTDNIKQILDVGSGSGAIGISLSIKYPALSIILIEKYINTIKVLKENVNNLGGKNIRIIKSNILSNFLIDKPTIVVANLPYIPLKDYEKLDNSVKNFEPKTALLGGKDGLDLINKLLKSVENNKYVKTVVLEIDPKQKSILEKMDLNFNKEFIKDFRGLFRFLKLYR